MITTSLIAAYDVGWPLACPVSDRPEAYPTLQAASFILEQLTLHDRMHQRAQPVIALRRAADNRISRCLIRARRRRPGCIGHQPFRERADDLLAVPQQ